MTKIPRSPNGRPDFKLLTAEVMTKIIPVMNGQVFAEALAQMYAIGFEDGKKQGVTDDNWQPIETAPKDGTLILIYEEGGRRQVAAWKLDGPEYCWCVQLTQVLCGDTYPTRNVTHWMPLPAPPPAN